MYPPFLISMSLNNSCASTLAKTSIDLAVLHAHVLTIRPLPPLKYLNNIYTITTGNNKYNKITIQTTLLKNNKKINCFAYQINKDFKSHELKPRLEYINFLRNGNKMHNLPKVHLNRVNYMFA